ncbi:MAG: LysR family transcriptional regulator [Verrucomicrobia bacterium]|nr:LysR family transcriptional regulator [Verrucomicrobiota bacterium]
MTKKSSGFVLRPRFRVERGQDIALGPGKVELLQRIRETGSIAEAAKRMQMSYMRAWTLVKTMEDCFREPLIQVVRGGARHGGARLTEVGEKVVALYRRLEEQASSATAETWRELQKLLRV